jgi:elongation factor P
MQFLYTDGQYHFMNTETYEQITVDKEVVGDAALFLKENNKVRIILFNGQVITIELPASVVLKIAQCEPGVRGDTVSGATKPATLETGAVVQVPLFVNEGEQIKVDTRSWLYIERA